MPISPIPRVPVALTFALLVGLSACGGDSGQTGQPDTAVGSDRAQLVSVTVRPDADLGREAGSRNPPPPIERLPTEGEGKDYPQPDLLGLSEEQVKQWAKDSKLGLSVFDSVDEIEMEAQFQPHRLTVVIEDDRVAWALVG